MKKIILSLLMVAVTMSVMAASFTSKATIVVSGDVSGYNTSNMSCILAEKSGVGAVAATGSALLYTGETPTIALYGIFNSNKYQLLVTEELGNLPIGFKACSDTEYTMTFGANIGELKLKDILLDSIIGMVNGKTYQFSIQNTDVNKYIEDRFQLITPSVYSRDVTDGSWGTLCLPWASVAVEGAEMFTVAGKDAATPTGIYVQEYANNLVAGQPYVFKATDSKLKVYYFPATGAAAGSANGLVGSLTEQTIAAGMYIIDDNQLKNTDGTCKVRENGAYFDFSKMSIYTPQPGAPVRFMSIRGATTDLEAAKAADIQEGKMIINGKFIIVKDGKMFNAQGAAL